VLSHTNFSDAEIFSREENGIREASFMAGVALKRGE
jgi:hypothetical protein